MESLTKITDIKIKKYDGIKSVHDENTPVFRRMIIPWYDSQLLCLWLIIFMTFIFFFGLIGFHVSMEFYEFNHYFWIPLFLCIMSLWTVISISNRLIKRYFQQKKEIERLSNLVIKT
ncbi:MAG: hypothetical protein HQK77_12665 [Desulfobacterales bacterium]|nr:hypothetical protein [Desulfobacterales bacterium]